MDRTDIVCFFAIDISVFCVCTRVCAVLQCIQGGKADRLSSTQSAESLQQLNCGPSSQSVAGDAKRKLPGLDDCGIPV
jgi:hypothetical protein